MTPSVDEVDEVAESSGEILWHRVRASGSLLLIGAAAIAAVFLTARYQPVFISLVRILAAAVIVTVAVMLFRDFRTRGAENRREDNRREGERRGNGAPDA